jgi:hypothetical protein
MSGVMLVSGVTCGYRISKKLSIPNRSGPCPTRKMDLDGVDFYAVLAV